MDEVRLSPYGQASTHPSPVARMMSEFAAGFRDGVDINLGVGYVDERTIPTERFLQAAEAVLGEPGRFRQPLNYGGPTGSARLVEAIRRFWIDNRVGGVTERQLKRRRIIIGVNGATSLLYAAASVMDPGIVVTADPQYYIYGNVLARLGFDVLPIAEDDEGPRADLLDDQLRRLGDAAERIRYLYFVTISNPTGTICTTRRKAALIDAAARLSKRLKREVPVILDRAYEDLIHDPAVEPPQSGMMLDKRGLVYEVSTLSKIIAPGIRIGYMIGPRSPFIKALVQATSDIGFSASPVNQAIAAWMLTHHAREQINAVNAEYRRRAVMVRAAIDEHLGAHLEHLTGGQAGFYYYLTLRDVETHERSRLFRFLARITGDASVDGPAGNPRTRVVYIPGEFCVHPQGQQVDLGRRQLRISYGFEQPERIIEGIRLMGEGVDWARR